MRNSRQTIEVSASRLSGWLWRFHEQHQVIATSYSGGNQVTFETTSGVSADCVVPLGSPRQTRRFEDFVPEPLLVHLAKPRCVGVLLVRLGGYAAGVFDTTDQLLASKVDSRLVHGRQRNGGSSQARYARRRDNEVKALIKDATETAARILLPYVDKLNCFVVGGDKNALHKVLQDLRLMPLIGLQTGPFLSVPNPKRVILDQAPQLYRMTRIQVLSPEVE